MGGRPVKSVSIRTKLAATEIILRPKAFSGLGAGLSLPRVATDRSAPITRKPIQVSVSTNGSADPIRWASQNARLVPLHLLAGKEGSRSLHQFVTLTMDRSGIGQGRPNPAPGSVTDLVYYAAGDKKGFLGRFLDGVDRFIGRAERSLGILEESELRNQGKKEPPIEDTTDRKEKGVSPAKKEVPKVAPKPFIRTPDHKPFLVIGGKIHPIGDGLLIGRNPEQVSFPLDPEDPTVSRVHAQIRVDSDGALTLHDLNSTTGTYLNDYQIPPSAGRDLNHGDQIRIGGQNLTLQYHIPKKEESERVAEKPAPGEYLRAPTRFILPSQISKLNRNVWLAHHGSTGENPILLDPDGRFSIGGGGLWDASTLGNVPINIFLPRSRWMFQVLIHLTPDLRRPDRYLLQIERGESHLSVLKDDGSVVLPKSRRDTFSISDQEIWLQPGDQIVIRGKTIFTLRKGPQE